MSHRWTWDETWLAIAHDMSYRSRCARAKVGAVIVDPTNRVVATSYNGPPSGWPADEARLIDPRTLQLSQEDPQFTCVAFCERGANGPTKITCASYEDCPSLHAEANGLMVCDRTARLGGTIYVTDHVCFTCAKLIANSGLKRVVINAFEDAEHRSPERSYGLLRACGLTVDLME